MFSSFSSVLLNDFCNLFLIIVSKSNPKRSKSTLNLNDFTNVVILLNKLLLLKFPLFDPTKFLTSDEADETVEDNIDSVSTVDIYIIYI